MAKRFTDTDKWKKSFIKSLSSAYKLLWIYITDDCDHAGIWHVDIEIASLRLGEDLNMAKALEAFEDKIVVFDDGEKWFIPSFIEFQYGELNEKNRAHQSVIKILKKYNLLKNKGLTRCLQAPKDKDKDKDKDKGFEKSEKLLPEVPADPIPLGAVMQQEFLTKNPDYPSRPGQDIPAMMEMAGFISQQNGGVADMLLFKPPERAYVAGMWSKFCDWYSANGGKKSLDFIVKFKLQEIYSTIKNGNKSNELRATGQRLQEEKARKIIGG